MNGSACQIKTIHDDANKIELQVSAQGNTFLFASEIYYPGWKVLVDGKKSRLYAANLAFRAVPLEKGDHRVIMQYDSGSFKAGMAITLSLLLVILILLWNKIPLPPRLLKPWIGLVKEDK